MLQEYIDKRENNKLLKMEADRKQLEAQNKPPRSEALCLLRTAMTDDELYFDDMSILNSMGKHAKAGKIPMKAFDEAHEIIQNKWKDRIALEYKHRSGKYIKPKDDAIAEITRLYNNIASRTTKKSKQTMEDTQEKFSMLANLAAMYEGASEEWIMDRMPDENDIRPIDERRYCSCFKTMGGGQPLDYIKRMTGLSVCQIYILQEKYRVYKSTLTGLSLSGKPYGLKDWYRDTVRKRKWMPSPQITKAQAAADAKRRRDEGEYY